MVIDRNLRLVFLCYGNYLFLTGFLLLIGIPFVKAWAVMFLVHSDISIKFVTSLVHHVLQIERAATVECLTLFF